MKTSEVFAWAQTELWVGPYLRCPPDEREYICHVLDKSDARLPPGAPPPGDLDRARSIVQSRLDYPDQSLESWVEMQGVPHEQVAEGNNMQEYRVQWLRMLQEEFEAKGD